MRIHHLGLSFVAAILFAAFSQLGGCMSPQETHTSPKEDITSQSEISGGHENMNAVLWVQTSAEYKGNCLQAYQNAMRAIDVALKDVSVTAAEEQMPEYESLPPAVILDVDETVLDNSPYQARLILNGKKYDPATWHAWCEERKAAPVPGALAFTKYANSKGVTVFYVTNRDVKLESATRDNLKKFGFPIKEDLDVVLLKNEKPDWTSDKRSRRKLIAKTHRIVMLCGDNLGDFVGSGKGTVAEREQAAIQKEDYWGSRWINLPNPTYGYWEGATIDYQYGADEAIKRRLKENSLNPN